MPDSHIQQSQGLQASVYGCWFGKKRSTQETITESMSEYLCLVANIQGQRDVIVGMILVCNTPAMAVRWKGSTQGKSRYCRYCRYGKSESLEIKGKKLWSRNALEEKAGTWSSLESLVASW